MSELLNGYLLDISGGDFKDARNRKAEFWRVKQEDKHRKKTEKFKEKYSELNDEEF